MLGFWTWKAVVGGVLIGAPSKPSLQELDPSLLIARLKREVSELKEEAPRASFLHGLGVLLKAPDLAPCFLKETGWKLVRVPYKKTPISTGAQSVR